MWYALVLLFLITLIQGWQLGRLREDMEAAHKCAHRQLKAAHENTRNLKKAFGAFVTHLGYRIKEEHEVTFDIRSILGGRQPIHTHKFTVEKLPKVRKLEVTSVK